MVDQNNYSNKRPHEISLKGDSIKPISIGVKDADEAIQYYFTNTINPTVTQNGNTIKVPVVYGAAERWDSVQKGGFYRDKTGKVLLPIIVFKRDSITPNRQVGNKLDGNKAHNAVITYKKFSKRNVYDNFYVLTNQQPQSETFITVIPDYVTIEYSCVVFTDYTVDNNKIIESIIFASNAYWGDPTKYIFRARVDSYQNQTEIEQGTDRAVKTTFKLILEGYLIPDSINKELAILKNKYYNITKVVFNVEAEYTKYPNINTIGISSSPQPPMGGGPPSP